MKDRAFGIWKFASEFSRARGAVAPWALTVEDEGGALLGRLQGALRGGAAAASPSRVAKSIRGYLTNKVGSLQLRDTGMLNSFSPLAKPHDHV